VRGHKGLNYNLHIEKPRTNDIRVNRCGHVSFDVESLMKNDK
jgi:ribosomal protein L37E